MAITKKDARKITDAQEIDEPKSVDASNDDMTEFKDAKSNTFAELSQINVNKYLYTKNIRFKNGGGMTLDYLQWTWAFAILKKMYGDDFEYHFTEFQEINTSNGQLTGKNVDFNQTSNGAYVECTVTIKGHKETQTLPVMDGKNNSVKFPDMVQVNNTKQRCFVKTCAMHGLGINVYTKEDMPLNFDDIDNQQQNLQNHTNANYNQPFNNMAPNGNYNQQPYQQPNNFNANIPVSNGQIEIINKLANSCSQMTGQPIKNYIDNALNNYNVNQLNQLTSDQANAAINTLTDFLNKQ